MSFQSLLNRTCTIQGKATVQYATGSVVDVWADQYTNVPCRFSTVSQSPGKVQAGLLQLTMEDFSFYFLPTQDISIAHRIKADGVIYEVRHVFEDSSGHHKKVIARRKSFE